MLLPKVRFFDKAYIYICPYYDFIEKALYSTLSSVLIAACYLFGLELMHWIVLLFYRFHATYSGVCDLDLKYTAAYSQSSTVFTICPVVGTARLSKRLAYVAKLQAGVMFSGVETVACSSQILGSGGQHYWR